jgi:predicted metal-dependent peptidase
MSVDAQQKVMKAKAQLVLLQPFFATILFNLPIVEDNTIPTMATNGMSIRWSREFVDKLSIDEVKFVLCHEVGHCIFQHMYRKGSRQHKRWNQAGDYVINDLLVKEGIGSMPEGGLHNPGLVQAANGYTEGVYDLLPDLPDGGGGGSNGHGDPMDDCEDAPGESADQAAQAAEMQVRVAQAAQAAKACGQMSSNIQRLVDTVLKPKVDWREVLRRFVASKAKNESSFARPKRRFISQDLYLPSLSGEQLGEICVAIDCSGSVDEKELAMFFAELRAIKEDMLPERLHVIYFDHQVSHVDSFERDEEFTQHQPTTGGTAFSPIFRKITEIGSQPEACVVLTDLVCSDFGPTPPYPVLWITTDQTETPWGEVVEMHQNV